MSADLKSSAPETDDALLARMAQGDENALGTLYDRYAQSSFSLAATITGDPAHAEHVVADAFAELWRNAGAASSGSVWSRLTALVRARALKMKTRAPGSVRILNNASDMWTALPAAERRAIELAFLDGLTVRQIALQLEAPENDIARTLRSAMTLLRRTPAPRNVRPAGKETTSA